MTESQCLHLYRYHLASMFSYMTMKHCQVKRFKYTWKTLTTPSICMSFLCKSFFFHVLNAACNGFQCGLSSESMGCFMIVLNLFLFLRYPTSVRCLGSKDTAAVDETDVRVLSSASFSNSIWIPLKSFVQCREILRLIIRFLDAHLFFASLEFYCSYLNFVFKHLHIFYIQFA